MMKVDDKLYKLVNTDFKDTRINRNNRERMENFNKKLSEQQ